MPWTWAIRQFSAIAGFVPQPPRIRCRKKSGVHGANRPGNTCRDEDALRKFDYIADPHTAVGVLGWEAYKGRHPEPAQGLVLATAHPAKFADVVEKAIGTTPPLPDRLAAYLKRDKLSLPISSTYDDFTQFLLAQ